MKIFRDSEAEKEAKRIEEEKTYGKKMHVGRALGENLKVYTKKAGIPWAEQHCIEDLNDIVSQGYKLVQIIDLTNIGGIGDGYAFFEKVKSE